MSIRTKCILLILVFSTIALMTAIKTDLSYRKFRGLEDKISNQVDVLDTRKNAP